MYSCPWFTCSNSTGAGRGFSTFVFVFHTLSFGWSWNNISYNNCFVFHVEKCAAILQSKQERCAEGGLLTQTVASLFVLCSNSASK